MGEYKYMENEFQEHLDWRERMKAKMEIIGESPVVIKTKTLTMDEIRDEKIKINSL
jgi:hypothetical protein